MVLVETEFCLMNLFCNMCFHIYKEDKWDGSRTGGLNLFIVQDYKRGRRRRTVLINFLKLGKHIQPRLIKAVSARQCKTKHR